MPSPAPWRGADPSERFRLAAVLVAVALALTSFPLTARSQESFIHEVKLAADREKTDVKKLRPGDLKTLEAVLKKRLPILGVKEGTIQTAGWDDIRVRVAVDKLDPSQLKMFALPGRLEIRSLDDVETEFNPGGRYLIDVLSVQGDSTLRFKDKRTNLPIKAEQFIAKCPMLIDNDGLEPETAHRVGEGVRMAVRIHFSDSAARHLRHFTDKPGRLLAVTLDGAIVSMHAVARTVKDGKRGKKDTVKPEDRELGGMDLAGGFDTDEEAGYLAAVLNAGPLPCALAVRSSGIVPP